ncbi:C2H2-type zinc finger transcription factor [Mucor lusitanicus CBS 277.49]|uniref:C2H2-type zinc finger transcription factor n=1 Tax=Mucor lusitanicus CBS 277.49 TaxID=747725 RepID=A0A162RAV2_MUCCL|nr:C2H2-type zinc finger transcription factor [Mucor lusitanicus CBS 277.49]
MKQNISDYHIATDDHSLIINDNASLRHALKSDNQQRLEIVFYRKDDQPKNTSMTVVQNSDDMNSDRKDSAISLENVDDEQEQQPHRKKQRVMSADHPRKLPDPSTSPLPSLRNSINLDHNNSMSHGLHPLEIRRPSTAPLPSSPPASPFPRIHSASATTAAPTLPAISSITSPIMHQPIHPQLAPIHNHHLHLQQQQQQQQQFNINNKRTRASVASTHHAHNMQQNTVHLCEHVTGPGKVCGQTFRRSYDLSRHQTIHLENRPFCYCDKCGKKFTRMDALRRHERVQGHSSKHRSMSTSLLPSSQKATSV